MDFKQTMYVLTKRNGTNVPRVESKGNDMKKLPINIVCVMQSCMIHTSTYVHVGESSIVIRLGNERDTAGTSFIHVQIHLGARGIKRKRKGRFGCFYRLN